MRLSQYSEQLVGMTLMLIVVSCGLLLLMSFAASL